MTDSEKPPFPPGSILRTAWYDEVFVPGSYEASVDNGWESPGIKYYKSTDEILGLNLGPDYDYSGQIIPFNERGLLYITYWVEPGDSESVWYQVIWEDRLIWIVRDWLVLVKSGSGDAENVVP